MEYEYFSRISLDLFKDFINLVKCRVIVGQ